MNKELFTATSYQDNCQLYAIAHLPQHYSSKTAAIYIPGFERFGGEQKWRILSQELSKVLIPSILFDFTGLGLSEGIYNNPTIEHLLADLESILRVAQSKYGFEQFILIGHSLGACVAVSAYSSLLHISKIVLLSPALDQASLNRYRYTMSTNKLYKDTITRDNYTQFFNEKEYILSISKPQLKKANTINSQYMQEMSELNFQTLIKDNADYILHIHGDKDNTVPLGSITRSLQTKIIVGGDHDLEKPTHINQRIHQVILFITS